MYGAETGSATAQNEERQRVGEKDRETERERGRVTAAPGKCFLIGSNM